jgi:hypothetical protein
VQVRDLQGKVDNLTGKPTTLNFLSKAQLNELQEQLKNSLGNV